MYSIKPLALGLLEKLKVRAILFEISYNFFKSHDQVYVNILLAIASVARYRSCRFRFFCVVEAD